MSHWTDDVPIGGAAPVEITRDWGDKPFIIQVPIPPPPIMLEQFHDIPETVNYQFRTAEFERMYGRNLISHGRLVHMPTAVWWRRRA